MAEKIFDVAGIGKIHIVKRRGNRNIRLSFATNGDVRISLPYYAPYQAGLSFARSKQTWITKHQPARPSAMVNGQMIANKYRLIFKSSPSATRPTVRLKQNQIIVTHASSQQVSDGLAQAAARRGAIRALKAEAENILPTRLAELARINGYKYRSLRIKPLKTRWGSCDQDGNIKLNLYLVQLEPELIDYVIMHELAHTKFQHHQAAFWQEMRRHLPGVDALKKRTRSRQPTL